MDWRRQGEMGGRRCCREGLPGSLALPTPGPSLGFRGRGSCGVVFEIKGLYCKTPILVHMIHPSIHLHSFTHPSIHPSTTHPPILPSVYPSIQPSTQQMFTKCSLCAGSWEPLQVGWTIQVEK